MLRRNLLKLTGGAGVLLAVPALYPPARKREYFFGGFAPADDTAWLQAYLNKGGGRLPDNTARLTISQPLVFHDETVLGNAYLYTADPEGLRIMGERFMFYDNYIVSDGNAGLTITETSTDWKYGDIIIKNNVVKLTKAGGAGIAIDVA